MDAYLKAKRIGDRQYRNALFHGKYPYIPALNEILKEEAALPSEDIGLLEIPLTDVIGTETVGRQNAFSEGFMPILPADSEFAEKWSALFKSQLEEGIREPVKVFEYLKRFYVREGNKRVSISKFVGSPTILAEVTRILPRRSDDKEIRIYYEFLDFFEVSSLYEISFSEEGCYKKFADFLGLDLTHRWPKEVRDDVRSAYLYFSDIFKEKGGEKLQITPADAFLVYLEIYSMKSILDDGKVLVSKRIQKLWKELLTYNNYDRVALSEDPEGVGEESGLLHDSGILRFIKRMPGYSAEKPLKAAFLYDRDPAASGRIYGHELGRSDLVDRFDGMVTAEAYKDLNIEEKIRTAIDTAVEKGVEMIFTVSPMHMPETLKAAIHYPTVKFLNCSVNLAHNAVRTYDTRMYEAKFLMGALAAAMAPNHRISYLASYPIYGAVSDINAFAIGAELVDPKAVVYLSWSSVKGFDWHRETEKSGAEVFSGPDLKMPELNPREYGVYMRNSAGEIENLAAPMRNWGKYYTLIIQTVLDGTYAARSLVKEDQALSYWWGLSSGVVDVLLSEKLPYTAKKLVETLKGALLSNALNPFDGELRSQNGVIKEEGSERLKSPDIIKMNWLNDNVIGEIPPLESLDTAAQKIVKVSGMETGFGV